VIDTDLIAHQLTSANGQAIDAIATSFGTAAVLSDGSMNRIYMRELVFKIPTKREQLETILHPLIRTRVLEELSIETDLYHVVVVPLLVEKGGWDNFVDAIVVVDCAPEIQIARIKKRNGFTDNQIQAILNAQADRNVRLEKANFVIQNDTNEANALKQVGYLHQQLIKLRTNG
jgi:dephospho-CoA kinase